MVELRSTCRESASESIPLPPLCYRLPSVAGRWPVPGVAQPRSSGGSARHYSPVPWDEESVLWVKGRKTFDDTMGSQRRLQSLSQKK